MQNIKKLVSDSVEFVSKLEEEIGMLPEDNDKKEIMNLCSRIRQLEEIELAACNAAIEKRMTFKEYNDFFIYFEKLINGLKTTLDILFSKIKNLRKKINSKNLNMLFDNCKELYKIANKELYDTRKVQTLNGYVTELWQGK